MHYQILQNVGLEFYFAKTSILDNFLAVLFDVTLVFLFFLLITWGKTKVSIACTFIITLLFSFTNVLYSRFFGLYLTFSAIGQVGNLNDDIVIKSIMSEFRIHDVCYLISFSIFLFLMVKWKKGKIKNSYFSFVGLLWGITIILILASHSVYWVNGSFARAIQTLFPSRVFSSPYPNWTSFHKGLIRTIVLDNLLISDGSIDLTEEQKTEIAKEYKNHANRKTAHVFNKNIQNVIFIIVESYMAVTSELKVDGKEITPYLNSLKRDSNVYYNGHMQPNAKIGKSSDGQFIYMTGLLPLRSEITVSQAKKDTLVGLPKQLLDRGLLKHSQILVPTAPSFWEQQAMNPLYGFEKMYSKYDYDKNVNGDDLVDEQMFEFAMQLDKQLPAYSFSMMLTLSMHEPFDECVEHGFHLSDPNLPMRYKNYLTTCHYFDQQIGKYIDHLKSDGLYANSLIIIAADHDAHPKFLDMEGKVSRDLPLFIINGDIDNSTAWTGECNQLDVYTTLLDILGVDCEWRGLGHTLLTKDYKNSVTDRAWELSEWIIMGDFFGND
jgi:lipoteichoic acid synthase